MHQALYRKWRPKSFDDVYGQDHITSILKYQTDGGRFSHAYLFCGSRGTGKTTCAKILAKAVNCEHPVNGSPCGECDACRAIEDGTTTDVIEMDAASNNGVDNIRDIRDEVNYMPSMLKYRVYIVDEVHMLSGSAFNALLKTLEEPPAHIIFILATTEVNKLLPTIVSRCQRFDFRRIAAASLTARMKLIAEKEGIDLRDDGAALLARLAQGGMRDAISLLELCAGTNQPIDAALVASTVGVSDRSTLTDLVHAVLEENYAKMYATVADVVSSARDLTVFWQDLINYYRDLLITKTAPAAVASLELSLAETEELKILAGQFTRERLLYHAKLLDNALGTMQRTGSIRRAVAELTLAQMADAALNTSNEALAARIADLEGRIWSGQTAAPAAPSPSSVQTPAAAPKREDAPAAPQTPQNPKPVAEAVPAGESPVKPVPAAASDEKQIRDWAATAEYLQNNPAVASFIDKTRAYRTADGKIAVVSDSDFIIGMMKNNLGILCNAVRAALHMQVTEDGFEFRVLKELPQDDGLDDIERALQ